MPARSTAASADPPRNCDHTSVGLLVWQDGRLLLLERARPPWGWAPPAGHLDGDLSYDEAGRRELDEEVGLTAGEMREVARGRRDNACRRPGGTWHDWVVFEAAVSGRLRQGVEAKQLRWAGSEDLTDLARRARLYERGLIDERSWQSTPGLEPVWVYWLQTLGVIAEADA